MIADLRVRVIRLTEELLAGGPTSGWYAENGHVSHLTPASKATLLQKMGYSLSTHDPNGTMLKDTWTHPSGVTVTVSKYNAPNQPNLRKYEVYKGVNTKVFSGHQFSKVQDAHAKATGEQLPSDKKTSQTTSEEKLALTKAGFTYVGKAGDSGVDLWHNTSTGISIKNSVAGYEVFNQGKGVGKGLDLIDHGGKFTPAAQSLIGSMKPAGTPKTPSIPAESKNVALTNAGFKYATSGTTADGKAMDIWTNPTQGGVAHVIDEGNGKSSWQYMPKASSEPVTGKYANDLTQAIQNNTGNKPVAAPSKPAAPPEPQIKTDAAWRDKLQATVAGLWDKTDSNQYSSSKNTLYPMAAKEMGIPWNKVTEVESKIGSWQGGNTANDGNPIGKWSQQVINGDSNAHPGMMLEYAHTQEWIKQNGVPNGGTFYRGYKGSGSVEGMPSQVTMLNLVAKNSPDQYHVGLKTFGAEGFSTSKSVADNFTSHGSGAMVVKVNVEPKYIITGKGANPEMWDSYGSEQEWALAFPKSVMPISSFAGDKIHVKGAAASVSKRIFFNALDTLKKWGWNYTVDGNDVTIIPPPEKKDWLRQLRDAGITSEEEVAAVSDVSQDFMRSVIAERALGVESKAYKLAGVTSFQGLPISIENKKGDTRSGVQKDGSKWSVQMPFDYGYIKGTVGADGQHVDCFIGPLKTAKFAYVVHQTKFDKSGYDEDKVMLGFPSAARAEKAYRSAYNNVDLFYSMSVIPMHEFIRKVLATKGSKRPGKIHAEAI